MNGKLKMIILIYISLRLETIDYGGKKTAQITSSIRKDYYKDKKQL